MVEVVKTAGIKFVLVLSLPVADFPDTIFRRQFHEIEATVTKLNVPHAFLCLPNFVENY